MTPRLLAVRLLIRLKRGVEAAGVRRRADVYVDCIGEWRYPAFLAAALRRCGARVLEVPARQAVAAWGAEGARAFLFGTRLLPDGAAPTAPVVVAREPDRLAGAPRSRVRVSVDWFSREARREALVMPYFADPGLRRVGRRVAAPPGGARPFRVGFAGVGDVAAYRDRFRFPMPSRGEALEEVIVRFAGRVAVVATPAELAAVEPLSTPIVLVTAPGRRRVLAARPYLEFLGRCSFFLALPGVRMPLAHNLVEGMSAGAIPILSYADWLEPPLEDGVDCLAYATLAELGAAVERALALDAGEVERLRANVRAFHAEQLSVDAFARRLCPELGNSPTVLVNAERESAALWQSRDTG